MGNLVGLAWRLLRGGGRRGLLGAGLTAAAVAISTALLLFTVAVNFAFQGRADREAWRNPVAAADGTTAVAAESVRTDHVRGRRITVVNLTALKPDAPAPPGLTRFPAPGEVWFSPALAELAGSLSADQLADRFPGRRAGTVEEGTLVHPGELLVVRGQSADSPEMTAKAPGHDDRDRGLGPVRISSFTGQRTDEAIGYQILGVIASVLMVVPLLVFGGAAARLTVARRDQRLAALRLVGATPGQVVTMTVAEAVITAFCGALLGLALYGACSPLLTGIEVAGGSWFLADLWPGAPAVAGVLAAVPLLVGLSAVAGLRRVVVSPLGVARRETPPAMRFVRVVALLAALATVPVVGGMGAGVGIFALSLGLAFGAVNLAGPWVVGRIGRIVARTARGPARLLAGSRLIDDPRSAWRTVSGVAMIGFIAGFIGLLVPDSGLLGSPDAAVLRVSAPPARLSEVAGQARERLSAAGVPAAVRTTGGGEGREGRLKVVAVTPRAHDAATLDRARTALSGLVPGGVATTAADDQRASNRVIGDIRTGVVAVLAVSFLVAIASAGITAASSVLDRRQTYALLRLAGTPLSVLNAARRSETLIPLTVMGGGTIAAGMLCALPFVYAAMNTSGLMVLLTCVVLGFAGVAGAGAASAPLLRSVTADPAPRPD
ncbi:ABC transporter permease [Streptosporangium sp. NPDC048047]|uniref:ABC transporter permease n=1 Tax=Streptosporangium sp. NPDC048047 TaxID=3155748 RepID=UPI003421FC52